MKILILFFLLFSTLFSETLESLLGEYEATTENSLQTVDEKLGHVFIYSQKEIRLMQHNKLNDILKELPLLNLNKNRFGTAGLSLAGSKTTVSGFFRLFINDHEVSSLDTLSPALSWGDMPLDFVDHIEIYYGESSFTSGSDTGIYFIRLYTKSPSKENGSEIKITTSSHSSNSQSLTHSQSFENGWSFLIHFSTQRNNESANYKGTTLENDEVRKYFYLDAKNENTNINFGYTDVKKDNYMGASFDVRPDSGSYLTKNYFVNLTQYFLDDQSLKTTFSVDVNDRRYDETNSAAGGGLSVIPVLNLASLGTTLPKAFNEDVNLIKLNANVSKTFNYKNNRFLAGYNVSDKKYDVKERFVTNFANVQTNVGDYYDFDEEQISSFIFQDDLKVTDELFLIGNAKFDKYKKAGKMDDSSEELYRVGAIYTPYDNFGLKTFYTKTYLPPSFFNVDFAKTSAPYLKTQKYKFYTVEGVYTTQNSKFAVTYDHVIIEDFIYLAPIGFINVDHKVKTSGLIFNYDYIFSDTNKLQINYFTTKLSETLNNSNKGGFIKYMGQYDKFEYFTSLIYRNAYRYLTTEVKESFDVSLGATYNYTKDLSFSIRGNNILDRSTKSIYSEGFPSKSFAFEDYGRTVDVSMKWVF